MRPVVGRAPQGSEAVGVYGASWFWAGVAGFALVMGAASSIFGPPDSKTKSLTGLLVWVVIGYFAICTPTLVITEREFIRRGRPLRRAIKWTEVAEVLPPGHLSNFMRVRLTDRAVVTLSQVGEEKAQSLAALMESARVS